MQRDLTLPGGEVRRLVIESNALKGNPLGDPTARRVDVYLPHGSDGAGLPLLVALAGFTGSGLAMSNWRGFGENLPERLDRLIGTGVMPPAVVAMPDCFTRLGGNQYINSAAMGRWEDFLIDDMLPRIEATFGCGGEGKRGVFGKSSGGYGALTQGLRHGGKVWSAVACHSGDIGFELCYLPDMPGALRTLARYDGSVRRFIEALESTRKPGLGPATHVLMTLAMAATYDPDPDAFLGIRLPVTMDTCELIPERWAAWSAWDPLNMVEKGAAKLAALNGLFIDCGVEDQYNLLYGARRLNQRLKALNVTHRYEEFDDTHSGIDYRLDESLPFLAQTLS